MDLRDTPEEAAFRAAARAWLAEHAPDDLAGLTSPSALRALENLDAAKAWSAKLAEAGYAGLTWPKEHGGGG
ncbi:MAG TPA: acyl-CoA dehydrogenase family protein, partial [Gaiellaceae bacterium]|nr:acyl-CoA dehydrogenase family protein [Gaiellaceae bacterium]